VLQSTGARLVYATTTPVPDGGVRPHRDPADVDRYNAVARDVMEAAGIEVHDLGGFAAERAAEIQRPVDVHFKPAGQKLLGQRVAEVVRAALSR